MTSLIMTKAIGSACQGTTSYEKPFVEVTIETAQLITYGMIAYSVAITESENVAITPSIGENLFVYCTNSAPVQIVVKGVIGYKDTSPAKRFPDFYKEHRVGNNGEILKVIIDKTGYKAIVTSYSRDHATTPTVTDNCSITFLAVREPQ